jgi:pilus assembly protein CpaC
MNGSNSFFGFLDFLRKHEMLKIMAEPNLVCVSGRPAFFNSGGEFPIIVPQSLGTVSVQYKKYGTQLDFVPIVLGNGNIRLEVKPRVSEIDNTRTVIINNNTVPALKTREAETGVEMQPGQTLAIAGLVYNRQESLSTGIPFFADLPYIGVAFRRNRQEEQEVELLILVTPQLVEPMDPCEVPAGGPGSHSATPNDKQFYLKGHLEVGTDAQLAPGAGAGQYPPHCPPPPGTFGPGPGDCQDGDCPEGGYFDGLPPGAMPGPGVPGVGPGLQGPVEEVYPESQTLPGPTTAARRGQPLTRDSVARQRSGTSRSSRGRVVKLDPPGKSGAVSATDRSGSREQTASSTAPSRPVVRATPRVYPTQSARPARQEVRHRVSKVSTEPGFIGPTGHDVRN